MCVSEEYLQSQSKMNFPSLNSSSWNREQVSLAEADVG